jgi:lysylphosphatidylglycerol synthetase-like protein (DUF2156 family)
MTVTNNARRQATRMATSRPLEILTRIGFVGYGLLYLAVAWLAVQLVVGHQSGETSQSGAFAALVQQPFGRFLLIVIAVGLAAMAVWQLLLAAVGHRAETGRSRTFERVVSIGRTVIYAFLAWTAYRILAGTPTSSAQQQQDATAGLLTHSAGQFLVVVCGLAVLGIGIGVIVYGVKRKFERKLMMYRMSHAAQIAARRAGQIGYVAKGIAFGIVGLLLVDAALTKDPGKSRGLDAALRTIIHEPFGAFLLFAIAVGFAAAGVYCFVQARYRKVTT